MVAGSRPSGFTFVEVLSTLLVVTIGLMGVVGLIAYGNRLSAKTQGETIAMATAISIASDPQPRLDPVIAADWSHTPYDFDNDISIQTANSMGIINGMYVRRIETSKPADVIAKSAAQSKIYARSALVEVTVYETLGGEPLASYAVRIVRQREAP